MQVFKLTTCNGPAVRLQEWCGDTGGSLGVREFHHISSFLLLSCTVVFLIYHFSVCIFGFALPFPILTLFCLPLTSFPLGFSSWLHPTTTILLNLPNPLRPHSSSSSFQTHPHERPLYTNHCPYPPESLSYIPSWFIFIFIFRFPYYRLVSYPKISCFPLSSSHYCTVGLGYLACMYSHSTQGWLVGGLFLLVFCETFFFV